MDLLVCSDLKMKLKISQHLSPWAAYKNFVGKENFLEIYKERREYALAHWTDKQQQYTLFETVIFQDWHDLKQKAS